jgi:hypothetical protein
MVGWSGACEEKAERSILRAARPAEEGCKGKNAIRAQCRESKKGEEEGEKQRSYLHRHSSRTDELQRNLEEKGREIERFWVIKE